jgi:hypothetical protein
MALQSSGQISLNDIATELALTPPFSLRSMSSAAGFSTPDAVSEFYGYSAAVTYTYYATWALDDPCFYDYLDIVYGSDSKYYVDSGGYTLLYDYSPGATWYEFLYYEPLFDANVYNRWTVDSTSTTLSDDGLALSNC